MPDNGRDRMDRIETDLERLKERHEALTQTVEIIAGMQRENETSIRGLIQAQRKNETLLAQVIEAVNSLAGIAASHERRLNHLETGG
jgi:archaellum component FlaC